MFFARLMFLLLYIMYILPT
uniref:Uncharacterized protein n=1 Tax=Arundo donax TaxID=35708 RepID=A0A0A9HRI5_ARUDO